MKTEIPKPSGMSDEQLRELGFERGPDGHWWPAWQVEASKTENRLV